MTTTVTIRHHEGEHEFVEHVVCTDPALNAVLFDFNPAGRSDVTMVKALGAALVQKMRDRLAQPGEPDAQKRNAAIAITELEGAVMRAVKSYFAK